MIVPQIDSLHVHSLRFDQVYKFESLVVFLLNKAKAVISKDHFGSGS